MVELVFAWLFKKCFAWLFRQRGILAEQFLLMQGRSAPPDKHNISKHCLAKQGEAKNCTSKKQAMHSIEAKTPSSIEKNKAQRVQPSSIGKSKSQSTSQASGKTKHTANIAKQGIAKHSKSSCFFVFFFKHHSREIIQLNEKVENDKSEGKAWCPCVFLLSCDAFSH